jgi:hypothetical protein
MCARGEENPAEEDPLKKTTFSNRPIRYSFRAALTGTLGRRQKERPIRVSTKRVTQNAEAARRVAELPGHFRGRPLLDEVGPQGLVLAMGGIGGDKKPAGQIRYLI